MEALLPFIVQVITGIIGGQAVGAALTQAAMGQLPKILSGAIGGVGGGAILGSLLGGDPATAGALGGLLGDAIGGAGGGAILTAIVGAVMKSMNKRPDARRRWAALDIGPCFRRAACLVGEIGLHEPVVCAG